MRRFFRLLFGWALAVGVVTAACWMPGAPARGAEEEGAGKEGAGKDGGLGELVGLLILVDDPAFQLDVLRGMRDALAGRRGVPTPPGWNEAYGKLEKSPNAQVRDAALKLALIFGDERAITTLRDVVVDRRAEPAARREALAALAQQRSGQLAPVLRELLAEPSMRRDALRALASYDDSASTAAIVARYGEFTADEKADAVVTLAARPASARRLLEAVRANTIPPRDVSAYVIRQINALPDPELAQLTKEAWGELRSSSEEKQTLIAAFKQRYTAETLARADLAAGKQLFERVCKTCHTLYGDGGKVGPDITGANRDNLDYLLENILDPSAAVARDYQMRVLALDDGRVLSGLVVEQLEGKLVLQTVNERVTIDLAAIESSKLSPLSMMPDGLVDKLTPTETRDLLAYLMKKTPSEQ